MPDIGNHELRVGPWLYLASIRLVLAHWWPNGEECPVVYSSWTLDDAERTYFQIVKEGLAVIFGEKKFNEYLYEQEFVIVTDHKPLLGLLKEDKAQAQITIEDSILLWRAKVFAS
eukprot:g30416.t1